MAHSRGQLPGQNEVLRTQRPDDRHSGIGRTLEGLVYSDRHPGWQHLSPKHRQRSEPQCQANGLCQAAFRQKAIQVGSRIPGVRFGCIEVRPIADMPEYRA